VDKLLEDEKLLERYLSEELKVVNRSLPIKRKTLSELLREEYPHVLTRDGGIHMFRKSELRLAYELLGSELASKLYLPIILEVKTEFKETVMCVNDAVAAKLVAKILGLKYYELPLYIYPKQLSVLRRSIGTLIHYAFTFS